MTPAEYGELLAEQADPINEQVALAAAYILAAVEVVTTGRRRRSA